MVSSCSVVIGLKEGLTTTHCLPTGCMSVAWFILFDSVSMSRKFSACAALDCSACSCDASQIVLLDCCGLESVT